MGNKYKNRCSMSLVIREMQGQTTVRYHFMSTSMTPIKRWTITDVGKDVKKLEPSYIASGKVNDAAP